MSLIVIILVDLFILTNVFTGLDDISRWHLSPAQAHPCYSEWNSYHQTTGNKDYDIVRKAAIAQTNENVYSSAPKLSTRETYERDAKNHLGNIASICLDYAGIRDKVNTPENQKIVSTIDRQQAVDRRASQGPAAGVGHCRRRDRRPEPRER